LNTPDILVIIRCLILKPNWLCVGSNSHLVVDILYSLLCVVDKAKLPTFTH
jgi:hypothetical protein